VFSPKSGSDVANKMGVLAAVAPHFFGGHEIERVAVREKGIADKLLAGVRA